MSWRYLAPAYSPVSVASMAGALRGLTSGAPAGLEQWLARRYEVDAALLVDSGTSALRLALQAATVPGAASVSVALPAYGCYDLATAAMGAGAVVSCYDVDPATLGPDWSSLGAALSGVDALVLVHQYGIPVDLDRARALADAHGAVVIEDAAQGAGGWWRHRRLGARGDLGILSFGRGKGMTAGGGGALLANGPRGRALLDRVRGLGVGDRGFGTVARLAAQAVLGHPMLYGLPARMPWLGLGDTPFHEPWPPRAIGASQAGVLQVAAELADQEAAIRRRIATFLDHELRDVPGVALPSLQAGDGTLAGWLRFPVLLDDTPRARAASPHFRQLGLAPGYPEPLYKLPALRLAPSSPSYPGAIRLTAQLVTLPTHRWVTTGDISQLRTALLTR